jgi:hypothetical protein
MPQAQILNRQFAYIAESTYGTMPATPQTQVLDIVSFDANLNAVEIQSKTYASHGQLADVRRGNTYVVGNLVFELNPTNADVFLEAGLGGTWAINVLKIGKTIRSFSMEEGYTDLNQFRVVTGSMINSLGMTLGSDGYAQITCGLVGRALSQWTATSLDTTPTAAAGGSRFFHDGGVYKMGGATIGTMDTLSWAWDNGLSPQFALSTSAPSGFTFAPIRMVKGKTGGQFDSVTELNKFITNTDSSVQYQLIAGTDSLDVKIGSLNYTNVTYSEDSGGIKWEADFTGKYNVTDASSIVITRV